MVRRPSKDFLKLVTPEATPATPPLLQGAAAQAFAGPMAAAWLAVDPPASGWGAATGFWIWTPVIAASLVDWAVRKWWFRYFGPGPLDQLLKRVLPPENTEAGRRSLDYIRRMRAELGMPPP